MNRPLLPPALAFAAGILANEFLTLPPAVWLAAAAVALLLSVVRTRAQIAGLWMGWIFAGAFAHAIHDTPLSPVDLRRLTGTEPRLVELRGVIAETPSLRLRERRGQWIGRTLVRLEVSAWRPENGDWTPASGRVMTATRGAFPDTLFRGRRVEVSGVLQTPGGPAAPGLFNYREHLRHSEIFRTLDVAHVGDWRPAEASEVRPPWSERFLPWAQRALARGLPDDEATRLLWAMTLGWKTALSGDVATQFMEAGTMHVFAISGLHIALIAGALVAVLRAIRLPRTLCGLLIIPFLWLYVAATGWQPSAVRSALMMSAVAGTWMLNRPADLINSLALSALAILMLEPGQLLQAGFQLSFGVVMGLALLVPALEPRLLRLLRFNADPYLPDPLRPAWKRAFDTPIRWLAASLATGGAAFLSSLPFTVHTFHLFSPIALLANLVVVPVSGLALAANAASLAVTPLWPGLASVFNASAWIWMRIMMELSQAFARVPGGVWYVPSPPWIWWWAYGALLVGIASGHLQTRAGLRRCAPIAAALLVMVAFQGFRSIRSTVLTVLPGGDALVVDGPGTMHDLVINTGGTSSGPGVLTPFLRTHGWNRVPTLLLTQADAARLGDGPGFLRLFRPQQVVLAEGAQLRSPAFRTTVQTAKELRLPLRLVSAGDEIAGWTVLSPCKSGSGRTADDRSLVLAGNLEGLRVLLLSHLSRQSQRDLLEREHGGERLRADIVIAGLPRDRDALIPDLLNAIQPRLVVITSAVSPPAQKARPDLRHRLEATGIPILYTEDTGTLTLETHSGQAKVRGMDGSEAHSE